jgi:hypothetical protein
MIRWLLGRWHARQRAVDLEILWPSCKKYADNIVLAKVAFAKHAFNDPAWTCLGDEEIRRRIDELT